ncbi:cyclin-O [Lepisosteus oculatus]|uniref:Cyclin O n=1 Tax=Lepisosteus oculatus TaxID=7918 RepID=W5M3F7_LEPOC|nr:PREDICTED: cyclin-O [Lepisosteus oculatus]XP_015217109.1 PREDICTED: cyclin-O [Lepisosteus oculatus]XP_015217128.1 PREDICTED: cyclin-O [Lepisosteus oculatus]XP_015217133.1 PREDICTED: cyclin-O [Lepisosteus oculatus]
MVAFSFLEDGVMKKPSPCKRKRSHGASPAKEDVTPEDRTEALSIASANLRAPCKKTKYPRHRKQMIESVLSDSGFHEGILTPCSTPSSGSSSRISPRLTDSQSPYSPLLDWQIFKEYGETCYCVQKNKEKRFHPVNCLAFQSQITAEARCKLVSWLIPVHRHFNLSFESCCLAINIMDRFLATTPVASDCFQLLGVTSLLIACKQVEVYPPRIKQLLALCCGAFSKDQLCNLECIVLIRLNFSLTAPTVAFFIEHFTNHRLEGGEVFRQSVSSPGKSKSLAKKIAELSLADYSFNRYPPSLLAVCAIQLADNMLGLHHPTDLEQNDYPLSVTEECLKNLKLLVSLNEDVLRSMAEL